MNLDLIREWLGGALVVVGGLFMLVAAVGAVRMPDVFTRMHAASVGDTLGIGAVILGLVLVSGASLIALKLLLLLVFIVLTNPVAAHAVARAALHAGIVPVTGEDDDKPDNGGQPSTR